jgi:hypothetical protein
MKNIREFKGILNQSISDIYNMKTIFIFYKIKIIKEEFKIQNKYISRYRVVLR